MCLTFPARIVAIGDGATVVDYTGRRRDVERRLVPDACPGENVLVGMGQILARLTVDEATSMARDMASITAGPWSVMSDGLDPPDRALDRNA